MAHLGAYSPESGNRTSGGTTPDNWHNPVRPSLRYRNSSLRSGDVKNRCLSAMGGGIVDRLNSGHHVSSSYRRNLLRIDRADHGRLCLHDSRLVRPESCTHQILSKPEHRCSHIADIALCRIPRYSDKPPRGLRQGSLMVTCQQAGTGHTAPPVARVNGSRNLTP